MGIHYRDRRLAEWKFDGGNDAPLPPEAFPTPFRRRSLFSSVFLRHGFPRELVAAVCHRNNLLILIVVLITEGTMGFTQPEQSTPESLLYTWGSHVYGVLARTDSRRWYEENSNFFPPEFPPGEDDFAWIETGRYSQSRNVNSGEATSSIGSWLYEIWELQKIPLLICSRLPSYKFQKSFDSLSLPFALSLGRVFLPRGPESKLTTFPGVPRSRTSNRGWELRVSFGPDSTKWEIWKQLSLASRGFFGREDLLPILELTSSNDCQGHSGTRHLDAKWTLCCIATCRESRCRAATMSYMLGGSGKFPKKPAYPGRSTIAKWYSSKIRRSWISSRTKQRSRAQCRIRSAKKILRAVD